MLKHRLIVGPILIAAFLVLVWLDEWIGERSGWRGVVLLGLGLIAMMPAAVELSRIFIAKQVRARPWLTAAAAMLGMLTMFGAVTLFDRELLVAHHAMLLVPTACAIMFAASLFTFSRGRTTQGVVIAAACVCFAFIYLGVMLGFYFAIRAEHSAWWIVGIIMTTKMCDSGAYFTGRAIGKHKLIPWLSPGKTWEGLFGGLIAAGGFGAAFAALSALLPNESDHISIPAGVICGVVFGIVGQLGDLCMSLAKRDAGIKDSSTILPGLGGLMDVLDSPILVAPVAYWLLQAVA